MKIKKILTILIGIGLIMTGCASESTLEDHKIVNQAESTESNTTNSNVNSTEKLFQEEPKNLGMKRIRYSFDSVFFNFDYSQEKRVDRINLVIDIPEYMVKSEDIENCKTYMRYDKENIMYLRGFVFEAVYRISSDFIMDDSIHEKTNYAGTWNSFTEFNVSTGVTSSGYNFVLYESKYDIDYLAYVYIRISDEYIVCLNYWDWNDNYQFLMDSIESIQMYAS